MHLSMKKCHDQTQRGLGSLETKCSDGTDPSGVCCAQYKKMIFTNPWCSHRQIRNESWPAHTHTVMLGWQGKLRNFLKNEPVQYFLGDASKSEEGQWEERAERSLGNLSSEHRKTGKAVGWTAYFFSASFGLEIPAFRHNLNIWGFGLPLPPPHPQSTVHLPSLHLLPWGARDFCMAEACVPGRRALRCRDSDCRAGMRSGRMSSGLPTCLRWALPSGVSSAWSVFSFLWNLWKMLSIFKNWAQNGKHQWSRSIEGILGRAEENVFSCRAKNDPEHNLASAKALCNPVSSSTFLVLRYSIFFCNGHCSLFSHKGRQKGYRVIQNWNNVSGFLIMT